MRREPAKRPGRCWPRGPYDDEALRSDVQRAGMRPARGTAMTGWKGDAVANRGESRADPRTSPRRAGVAFPTCRTWSRYVPSMAEPAVSD